MPQLQATDTQQLEPAGAVAVPNHGRETAEEIEGKSRSKSRKKKVLYLHTWFTTDYGYNSYHIMYMNMAVIQWL